MWSFLTDTAGGNAAKTITHDCADVAWGYTDAGGTIVALSQGEATDDLVDCRPRWPEMFFMYSFEIVLTFLVLNVLLGVVVDAVATARAEISDAKYFEHFDGLAEDDAERRRSSGRRLSLESSRAIRAWRRGRLKDVVDKVMASPPGEVAPETNFASRRRTRADDAGSESESE